MSEKEIAPESALEIYLRFNDDMEKDYCLQITATTTFRDLFKVFKTLPISLRPNLFYDPEPVLFVVLTAPGYLTEDGALLFSYETGQKKYQKRVSLDDVVAKKCWPGQLVLPVWHFNYFGYYMFITTLLTEVTKEDLIALGWTGAKKANADEYKEAYREYKIKEFGGMVPAHQAGLFTKLKHLGVFLGDGEGFNTPVSSKNKLSDITDDKLVLSYEYFVKQGEFFEQYTSGKSAAEVNAAINQFRRYGLMHSGGVLSELVEKRKAVGDTKLD
ncbi:hypothetical protein HF325_004026 [Metschnikowia pulcherrima]|uniref:Uncharacterized protein n=1 Tax=Metschnikowia pulcherrima TaxID=27326 RepID=A0A8H7GQZ8_9ASCO|nr:hypothetical protein HF325_004026 [Metschnikowia pulcherrima]